MRFARLASPPRLELASHAVDRGLADAEGRGETACGGAGQLPTGLREHALDGQTQLGSDIGTHQRTHRPARSSNRVPVPAPMPMPTGVPAVVGKVGPT